MAPPGDLSGAQSAERILYGCLECGLSVKLGGGNVITLCPPLTVTDDELDRAFSILENAVAEGAGSV